MLVIYAGQAVVQHRQAQGCDGSDELAVTTMEVPSQVAHMCKAEAIPDVGKAQTHPEPLRRQ